MTCKPTKLPTKICLCLHREPPQIGHLHLHHSFERFPKAHCSALMNMKHCVRMVLGIQPVRPTAMGESSSVPAVHRGLAMYVRKGVKKIVVNMKNITVLKTIFNYHFALSNMNGHKCPVVHITALQLIWQNAKTVISAVNAMRTK